MSSTSERRDDPIRLLVVARHPFTVDDLGLADLPDVEMVHLIRRPGALTTAIDETQPTVVMIDTAFADGRGITAIGEALAQGPNIKVIALTPDPAPHEDVAFAIRAGASGIVDVDTDPDGFAAAVRATHRGEIWLPPAEVRDVLGSVAADLDITSSERRTRLTGLALGLIPLMGAMATVMSLLWRRYLGHIGVRPVDLAIDPATRVVDAIAAVSMLIGVVGPLLFIGSWIDLGADHGFWHVRRRRLTHLVMSLAWLVAAWFLALFADLVLMIFVGPLVTVAVLARILDLDDELPSVLRMSRMNPRRAFVGGLFATVVFLTALSTEAMVTGPDFQADGVHGFLAPRVLGFQAQPMLAFAVDGDRAPREVLYLGGNADLYVLVYPCDDDEVEYVSVGSTRLVVIDEVTCATTSG